jgi:hypothetical protein
LIGLNLMGGGLWGVGFVIVDMRVRNCSSGFGHDVHAAIFCWRSIQSAGFHATDIAFLLLVATSGLAYVLRRIST